MTVSMPGVAADERAFLDSVEGEISFFRSIMRARPVGMHRHFHMLTIRNAIAKDTGRQVNVDSIWDKLRTCYDLDALDAIDFEAEGYISPKSHSSPISIRSPSPSENLMAHPFFREEFTLPYEDFEPIIAQRRMRATASLPSSPAASPAAMLPGTSSAAPSPRPTAPRSGSVSGSTTAPNSSGGGAGGSAAGGSGVTGKRAGAGGGGGGRKRGKNQPSKLNLAGLVGGDSDSSALTLESGDEGGEAETPRESVVTGTGTDAGTEYAEDEDTEMREPSPAQEASPRPARGRSTGKAAARGRGGRGGSTRGTAARGMKKKKR